MTVQIFCLRKTDINLLMIYQCLEILNLISIGISSYNCKPQLPSDIQTVNQYIPAENMKSQDYIEPDFGMDKKPEDVD